VNEKHKLADGVEVKISLYLTSDSVDADAVVDGTYRGGVKSIASIPEDWREAAAYLGIKVDMVERLTSDWRFMTRAEVMAHKARNPE
jgi:hypothetical protein